MDKKERDYIYHESVMSFCPQCMNIIPAKVVLKDSRVYLLKQCTKHGQQIELFEEDAAYYLRKREYDKPGTISTEQTGIERGCPFDCGLCPQHDQHTCIALIEVTNRCNLKCSVCYANAEDGSFLNLETIERMMDFYQEAEFQKAEILQISGGEPTTHPQIMEILKLAKLKNFKYVMLNTNGVRIAEDEAFVSELRQLVGGFEVYLQFDGFSEKTHRHFRGRDLSAVKKKAIDHLVKYSIPTTLVCTIEKGINDHEIGEMIAYGIGTKCIRGINFQPVAYFGRHPNIKTNNRVTLSGVINRIETQTNGMLLKDDFIPLPCNVERVAITYLYRSGEGFIPITRNTNIKDYLSRINNTFAFTIEDTFKEAGKGFLSTFPTCDCFKFMKNFSLMVPGNFDRLPKKERIRYVDENTFRISVTSFVDAYNFDMKSMQKECVHMITPDLKRIPFSAYNLLYREGNKNV